MRPSGGIPMRNPKSLCPKHGKRWRWLGAFAAKCESICPERRSAARGSNVQAGAHSRGNAVCGRSGGDGPVRIRRKIMAVLELTKEQIFELVRQMPTEQKREVLRLLAANGLAERAQR